VTAALIRWADGVEEVREISTAGGEYIDLRRTRLSEKSTLYRVADIPGYAGLYVEDSSLVPIGGAAVQLLHPWMD
jgi:hypothetical protein